MRYEVYCTARTCYLRTPLYFPDLCAAEGLAHAHQQRLADVHPSHVVILKDLNAPDPSKTEPATGANSGGPHA
jgi:hypothetical protein